MIRTVDLRVTIDAATSEEIRARRTARQTLWCIEDGWMTRALVTRLTQKRRAHLQKRRLRRSVRFMTVAAVFRDRLVFPKKRPAVFRMAARAGLIDGVFYKLRRRRGAMRRMARSTGHLAFAQRMM